MKFAGVSIFLIITVIVGFGQMKYGPFYYAGIYNLLPVPRINEETEISFADNKRLKLDIYSPSDRKGEDLPVVVFIHGGAWNSNSKDRFKFLGKTIARNGYIAVLPNYRLVPDHRYPAQIEDVAKAVKWTQENINLYGGNNKKIILSGHSAGGHLAALIGYADVWQEKFGIDSSRIDSLVLLAGVYKFSDRYEDGSPLVQNFVPEEYWEDAQPVNHLDSDDPPTFILHGLKDETVIPKQAKYLVDRLDEYGIKHKSILRKDLNHISLLLSFGDKDHDLWEEFSF